MTNYALILAGGAGTRFWPLSTQAKPKQFIDFLGQGRTLLQQTYDRMVTLCPASHIYVATNEIYRDLVKEQLPEIIADHILIEPVRKNTAPAVAYASYRIASHDPEAVLAVVPADHLIFKTEVFIQDLKLAFESASTDGNLYTFGIKPTLPHTGYGYLEVETEKSVNGKIFPIKQFKEKPELELAREFFNSGNFYWNAGIFVWSVGSFIKACEKYLPATADIFSAGQEFYFTPKEQEFITQNFPLTDEISLDFGILEKADNVFAIKAGFDWSDLGSWQSFYEASAKDELKNVCLGGKIITSETNNCLFYGQKDKVIVACGLEDFMVVSTDKALLICPKNQEQRVKDFVNQLKEQRVTEFI